MLFFYRSSYKEGLISQMSLQIEENLRTTKLTIENGQLDWFKWCNSLPTIPNAHYSLIDSSGNIACNPEKFEANKIKDVPSSDREYDSTVMHSVFFKTTAVFSRLKINNKMTLQKTVPISSLRDDMTRFDRVIFFKIVPFALLSYILFLILFYYAIKPLGSILAKVEKYKSQVPFVQSLKQLRRRSEWGQLEEALNKADQRLKDQVDMVKSENDKITAILESIYDDIIAVDVFETVLFYNTNFKKMFMRENNTHKIMPKLWHTLNDERVLEAFRSVLKDGNTVSLKSLNFLSSLHPERYFDLTITPLKNVEGKISGALGVFYDVTEFKLTEQMRVNFVANVSHEIRTPLTSIKGYSQILQSQKTKIPEDLHVFLEKIISNTERMISLFNDLLNLSVIESKNSLKIEHISLIELIKTVSENIKTNYAHKDIYIEQDLNLDDIHGDQRLMEQVISNLIDNACKYSGNHPAVKISSFKKDNLAYIIIGDNGPGIPKEHLQRIFERFYRVDSSRESLRGTGLGLSIVKHIIAKHHGKIWAESQETQGTTFIIELPLA